MTPPWNLRTTPRRSSSSRSRWIVTMLTPKRPASSWAVAEPESSTASVISRFRASVFRSRG